MKTENDLIAKMIPLLETALNVLPDPIRVEAFTQGLDGLSELQIRHAFRVAVKSWIPNYGRQFPSPAELRAYAEELDGPMQAAEVNDGSLEIADERLPKGWSRQEWQRARLTLNVRRKESARSLPSDGVPDEPRHSLAKRLIAEMRSRLKVGAMQFPKARAYSDHAEAQTRKRLPASTIPEDAAERQSWARQKAKETGWQ